MGDYSLVAHFCCEQKEGKSSMKMTEKELGILALKRSIKKWEKIVAEEGVDNGAENYALCQTFHDEECKGCPVAQKTKQPGCVGTPYHAWIEACRENQSYFPYSVTNEKQRKAAQAELRFLRSLLPKEEK